MDRYAPMPAHAPSQRRPVILPSLRRRKLDFLQVIAAVRRCLVVFAPRLDPLDGPAPSCLRAENRDEVTRIDGDLASRILHPPRERSPSSLSSGTSFTREQRKRTMCGILRGVPQRQLTGSRRCSCARAARGSMAFGIRRCWTMRSLSTTPFASAFCERLVDVATSGNRPVKGLVMPLISVVQLRSALFVRRRLASITTVAAGRTRRRSNRERHEPDSWTSPPRPSATISPTYRTTSFAMQLYSAIVRPAFGKEPGTGHLARFHAFGVGGGKDSHDAAGLGRFGSIDALDSGMGVRTAQHGRVQHAG